MDKKIFALDVLITIADTLIAALAIVAFAWGSRYFDRWWMLLFAVIPLALFNQHSLIVNADLERGEKDESSR